MVDPYDITNFARSQPEMEEFFLFCVAVAGKKATMIAGKIDEFLSGAAAAETPFEYVRRLEGEGRLGGRLVEVRLGKYGILPRAYPQAATREGLVHAPVDELEMIPGVGPKTARFFVLHTRPGARVAVIDTHVLKYLKFRGHRVPNGFPTGRAYAGLEEIMLDEMDRSGMDRAEFDLAIWSHYASNGAYPLPPVPPRRRGRVS